MTFRIRTCAGALVVYLPRGELVFLGDIAVAWFEPKTGGRHRVTVGLA